MTEVTRLLTVGRVPGLSGVPIQQAGAAAMRKAESATYSAEHSDSAKCS